MIRSSKVSLKFSNSGKKDELAKFLDEYRRIVRLFIDILWEKDNIPCLLSKDYTRKIETWMTARAVQCAGKQASSIVRGTKKKHAQRVWRLKQLENDGKDFRKLKIVLDKEKLSKPNIDKISAELDERFVKMDLSNETSFDGWITLGCLGSLKIILPFKKHSHFNKLFISGVMKKGVRVREKDVTFMFDIEKETKIDGKVLGIDVGISNSIATSEGFLSKSDCHNHTLTSILKKISVRKKGSNGFRRATSHRKNFINWSVNQLNLNEIKEVRRENIKNLRRGKKSSRFLSHWAYADIFDKLDRFCEEQGVLVTKVNPAYTSQICSKCGILGKRSGKSFVCSCGYENDSDLNASLNLSGEHIVPRKNNFLQKL